MKTRITHKLEAEDKRFEPRTLTIDPLTPVVGAEIGGVDLAREIPEEKKPRKIEIAKSGGPKTIDQKAA
jgi:hypothetical protein